MISKEIRNPRSHPFLIMTWYRPLKVPDEHFDKFEDYLNLADSKYNEIYILGDLNCNTFNITPLIVVPHDSLIFLTTIKCLKLSMTPLE